MVVDSEKIRELQQEKMQAVRELTELNAQHIKSQSRLSGLEIEAARYENEADNSDSLDDLNKQVNQLENELKELLLLRRKIDEKREFYQKKIRELDACIANTFDMHS